MYIKPITVMMIGEVNQTNAMPHKPRMRFPKRPNLDPDGVVLTLLASLMVLGCCAGVTCVVVGLLRL